MTAESLLIRNATPQDAEALLRIYAPYVRDTAVSFEYEPPTEAEFATRIATTLERYPYLVAQRKGTPVGYAYASPFKSRAAYDWSVELSVYVNREDRRGGVGQALYDAIEKELRAMGVVNLYACIATAEHEDEYVTFGSLRFHERMGFSVVALFPQVACKFDRWYDITWMHKAIGEHMPCPAPVAWKTPEAYT